MQLSRVTVRRGWPYFFYFAAPADAHFAIRAAANGGPFASWPDFPGTAPPVQPDNNPAVAISDGALQVLWVLRVPAGLTTTIGQLFVVIAIEGQEMVGVEITTLDTPVAI